MYKNTSWSR